ncbi:DUF6340 family protein [Carboxylicivirga marina]|uniref:Tetratricopeptide repeat protein n=1 Tax=Carboxylicivirga marina TaxID=2800988 RepID=A0ABS1HPS8_9BACT|nr:DUF6340 family protein [Carboxylicivirga marina]MBK3519547.1 hypothetical protein [Carboxylicivirga marina]
MLRNLIFLLITLVLVVSCKTYEVMHYDVLRPAVYSVPPQLKSIVIVDNAYPFNPDNAHIAKVMGQLQRLDTVRVDTFSKVIINQLKAELDFRRFFDTVYIDTIKHNTAISGKPLRSLTQAQIIDICNKYNVDALLSLDAAKYGTLINVQDMDVEYYSTMDVGGVAYWQLFDGYSTEALYADAQRDTLYWDAVGADINVSVATFPSLKDATIELGSYMGATYADELVPHWEPVERRVYIAGNTHFISAAEWLSKDNRSEAEKLWNFIYQHGNSREKGRAANNIAVSMEARGEYKLAMEWAFKSYQAFELKGVKGNHDERLSSKELYTDLVRRYRDQKKLDVQFGIPVL